MTAHMGRLDAYMKSNKVTAADGSTTLQLPCMVTHAQWDIAAVYTCRLFYQNWHRYNDISLQDALSYMCLMHLSMVTVAPCSCHGISLLYQRHTSYSDNQHRHVGRSSVPCLAGWSIPLNLMRMTDQRSRRFSDPYSGHLTNVASALWRARSSLEPCS